MPHLARHQVEQGPGRDDADADPAGHGGGQQLPAAAGEPFRPLGIRGIDALVDHRRTLGRVGGGFRIGNIHGPPIHAAGQRGGPVPGHRPDGSTQPRQMHGEGAADLASPEHGGAGHDVRCTVTFGFWLGTTVA